MPEARALGAMTPQNVTSTGHRAMRADTAFAVGVALLFACVCGFTMSYHEMWRDELQSWVMARGATSLTDLRERMRYEGHPALWYLLLYGVTRVTHRPEALQLLHLAIASACVFVFARSAPFPRWSRLGFALGYFPLYEYGVISRNYSIGILFLFLAAALLPQRQSRPWLLGILLALAAHTNAMATIVATAFAGTVFLEPVLARGGRQRIVPAITTLCLAAAGVLSAAMFVSPPVDTGYADSWTLEPSRLHAEHVFGLIARAVLPLTGGRDAWGDPWTAVTHHLAPGGSLLVVACLLPYLRRRMVAFVMFAAGTSALLVFFYTKLDGSLRHHGFIFVNLLLAIWFAEIVRRESAGKSANTVVDGEGGERIFTVLASILLAVHIALAAMTIRLEISSSFSAGRATAELLVAHELDELPIVGDPDSLMVPVLGYLHERTFFYPLADRFGSFTRYDQVRLHSSVTDERVFAAARELGQSSHSAVVVVLDRHASPATAAQAEEVGCILSEINRQESYCAYRLPPPRSR
jgi:hypothetical protein